MYLLEVWVDWDEVSQVSSSTMVLDICALYPGLVPTRKKPRSISKSLIAEGYVSEIIVATLRIEILSQEFLGNVRANSHQLTG
jgi:hypothetical protein